MSTWTYEMGERLRAAQKTIDELRDFRGSAIANITRNLMQAGVDEDTPIDGIAELLLDNAGQIFCLLSQHVSADVAGAVVTDLACRHAPFPPTLGDETVVFAPRLTVPATWEVERNGIGFILMTQYATEAHQTHVYRLRSGDFLYDFFDAMLKEAGR